MALWSLTLLHAWRAVGQADRRSWFVLSITVSLLLLTSYIGLALVLLLDLFLVADAARSRKPAHAGPVALHDHGHRFWCCPMPPGSASSAMKFCTRRWRRSAASMPAQAALQLVAAPGGRAAGACRSRHAGRLASGWPFDRKRRVPEVEGGPRDPLGRRFVYLFRARADAGSDRWSLSLFASGMPLVARAPLVVLSGLAVITACRSARSRCIASASLTVAWLGLLFLPPVIAGVRHSDDPAACCRSNRALRSRPTQWATTSPTFSRAVPASRSASSPATGGSPR